MSDKTLQERLQTADSTTASAGRSASEKSPEEPRPTASKKSVETPKTIVPEPKVPRSIPQSVASTPEKVGDAQSPNKNETPKSAAPISVTTAAIPPTTPSTKTKTSGAIPPKTTATFTAAAEANKAESKTSSVSPSKDTAASLQTPMPQAALSVEPEPVKELELSEPEQVVEPEAIAEVQSERPAAVQLEPAQALAQPEPIPTPEPERAETEAEPVPAPEPQTAPHPQPYVIPNLFIVQITPELAPVAKVGGLGDVIFGLSNELEIRGNHVEIILPKYDCLRYDHVWGLCETFKDLWVPWHGGAIHCTVYFGFVHGRKCFFIEPHSSDNFFNRGCIYGFNDDVMRFAFFSRAAMEYLWKSGKNPDIIHCHDWQTALVPVFLFEIYKFLGMTHPRVCYTIHNFKHQGVTGSQILRATGLNRPEYFFHYDRLRDNFNPHAINLAKAGVVFSNFVTTVSPRHASEAKDQGQGFGLEPTLHIHHIKYGGVVNGIDYNVWNPEIDRYIPYHYSADNLDDKYKNKKALRERLMITDNEKPIVAFVGRLDPQKGLELLRHAIFYTLHRRGQFVLLGSSPDGQISNYFWGMKSQLNDNPDVHIEIGFNEELSHLIYAGADIMLVPSRFEPCGLTQLIAMKYGTVPVVREVGGLADTVFDKDYSYKPLHERNGYLFRDYDNSGLESALGRSISCYYDYPDHFRALMANSMRYDFSWKNPGQDYLNIYDYIREK
jgi:starch synthase